MSNDANDHLESLHVAAVDSLNGYREAVKEAEGHGLSKLFDTMAALHARHAEELGTELVRSGAEVDDKGSYMSVVHKTIMDVRSLFGGLDSSILPGLIDGEARNVAKYDSALTKWDMSPAQQALLRRQRDQLNDAIAAMRRQKALTEDMKLSN